MSADDYEAMRRAAGGRMPLTAAQAGAVMLADEVDSTNTLARRWVLDGDAGRWPLTPDAVAVVAADRQNAGRGRLDHVWTSRPGESFTVSFVARVPRCVAADPSVNGWLQMIAGLAALDALADVVDGLWPDAGVSGRMHDTDPADRNPADHDMADHNTADGNPGDRNSADHNPDDGNPADGVPFGAMVDGAPTVAAADGRQCGTARETLRLKWPNDVFCGGRKLGGILAELVLLPGDPQAVAVVFGIGLNLMIPADRLPTDQATSLQLCFPWVGTEAEAARLRDMIAVRLARALGDRLARFIAAPTAQAAASADEMRPLCWTLGRRVTVHYADGTTMPGEALALNDDASLTVRDDAGALRHVRTADVGVLV